MSREKASPEAIRLRRRAEDSLRNGTRPLPGHSPLEEMQRLHHELQVHQIELEMQNEELRRAKSEADEALERFVDIYDFAPVGYLTLDHKGTIRAANQTAASLLGEDRSGLIGRPFKFFLANGARQLAGFLDQVFAGNRRERCEISLSSAGKAPVSVRLEALASSSRDECRVAIIDVTELRQRDFLLIAQNRLAAMGEMINNIAHQWRKPLNTLGLTIQQFLMLRDLSEADRKSLEEAVGNSMTLIKHMSQTIDDFKNYLKPDKEKVMFGVRDVVKRALLLLEENFIRQEISTMVMENDAGDIQGYPNELLQALLNILINAIDALTDKVDADRRITITLEARPPRRVLRIADNAGGISREVLGRIFDPYVTTKDAGKGTGIGLYLSKTIIEKSMRGSLTARNIPGGAEFRIEL